ncbi:MAG: hypothetical protein JOY54_13125 [Acidobacteriaceae bacterium]|nr:hypothetical protein [Acidobacteriaceae bacterium]
MHRRCLLVLAICAFRVCGQENADSQGMMQQILQRLDAIEKENRELVQEVRSLRQQLDAVKTPETGSSVATTPGQPTVDERVAVDEGRIAEQAQTKVEASQKFPVQLDGMLLFNAFATTGLSPGEYANEYGLLNGPSTSGATVRQTLLGLQFQGPRLPGDGRVNGSIMMDFWAGYPEPGNNWLRLRQADLSFDWANRSFSVGQEKPLISPYEPSSLAEVAIPPLAGAGNLWLWLPQARYEERLHFGANTGLTGQVAVLQTYENYSMVPSTPPNSLEYARPAIEARLAFWHKFDESRKFEVAPGFHASVTHVAGSSVNSRVGSLNWLFDTGPHLSITGTLYGGQNVAPLGAINSGFTITSTGVHPVHSWGGWTQFAFPITTRLTFNLFGGLEDDHGTNLLPESIARNLTYASNLMYHLGPNVVISLEGLRVRSRTASGQNELHNNYDLAIGYLF